MPMILLASATALSIHGRQPLCLLAPREQCTNGSLVLVYSHVLISRPRTIIDGVQVLWLRTSAIQRTQL